VGQQEQAASSKALSAVWIRQMHRMCYKQLHCIVYDVVRIAKARNCLGRYVPLGARSMENRGAPWVNLGSKSSSGPPQWLVIRPIISYH